MKALLVTLVLPHLALLGFVENSKLEALTIRNCPANPKLEALKKTLSLKGFVSRRKRTITEFPINCLHVAVVEFDDGPHRVQPIYDCCRECHFPHYLGCIFNGTIPEYVCGSRAHQCTCDCREAVLSEARESFSRRKPIKTYPSARICKKKTCRRFPGGCCIEDQCIKLFIHKNKSPVSRNEKSRQKLVKRPRNAQKHLKG